MRFLYEENGIIHAECEECGMQLKFKKYELSASNDSYVLAEGVECFCGCISNKINNVQKEYLNSGRSVEGGQIHYSSGVPRCPTCGSTNIHKISAGAKIGGAVLIGLYSTGFRNTFKCDNCGAKW